MINFIVLEYDKFYCTWIRYILSGWYSGFLVQITKYKIWIWIGVFVRDPKHSVFGLYKATPQAQVWNYIETPAFSLTVSYAFSVPLYENVENTWLDVTKLVFGPELRDQTQLSLVSHPILDYIWINISNKFSIVAASIFCVPT
jgi:hypothetical protein